MLLLAGAFAARADEPRLLTYSSGTGFFIREDGMLLTNYHVVSQCKNFMVYGTVPESPAKVIAVDKDYDLALLKSEALPLGVAALNSEKQPLHTGERVVVIGYPGQNWKTMELQTRETSILSTKGPLGEEKWLEFSDAAQKGNSGGPLLDNTGNVVGVVVAKGQLITVLPGNQAKQDVKGFDLAISLPVVRKFLAEHHITAHEADSGLYQSAASITDAARLFVVNVRCQWELRDK